MSGGARTGAWGRPAASWGILVMWAALLMLAAGCDDGDEPEPAPSTPDGSAPRPGDAGPGPEPEPEGADAATGWIELGGGARTFEALDPGQEVPIIAGIQGGFHVWGGFRGAGFDDSDVRLRFWLDLAGQTIARADYSEFGLPTDRRDPSVFDYAGVAVVYDDNALVQRTAGETMTLRVEVSSMADGQVMTDMIEVVPVCCE